MFRLSIFFFCFGVALCMEFVEKCCQEGINHGTIGVHTLDSVSCDIENDAFQKLQKQTSFKSSLERIMCKGFYKQCCITAASSQYCVLGMSFGKTNQVCLRGSNELAGDDQRVCCECCKSGRKDGAERKDCNANKFKDILCTHSYKECCEEMKQTMPVEPTKATMKTCKDIKCDLKTTESCTETSKGPQCICKDGFVALKDSITCQDIDECVRDKNICGTAKCMNEPGSYKCMCDHGYKYENKTCVKLKSEEIKCQDGYQNIEGKCVDVDECMSNEPKCPNGLFCLNYEGSYQCRRSCNYPHFEYVPGRNRICRDINECLNPNICDPDTQECINQIGSHICKIVRCPNGYNLTDGHCVDIDECKDKDICGKYGICRNVHGAYYCHCQLGYRFDSTTRKCEDIDECKLNRARCSFQCVNTQGSYHCTCPSGYEASGQHQAYCKDIDECKTQNPCSPTEYCFNTYGSFRCINETCPKPYYARKSEKHCQKMPCYGYGPCTNLPVNSIKWAYYTMYRDVAKHGFVFTYSLTGFGPNFKFNFDLTRGNIHGDFEIHETTRGRIQVRNKNKIRGPKYYPLLLQADAYFSKTNSLFMRFQYELHIDVSAYTF